MDLFDDLPPPKAPSELPSNGSASTGSSESKAITDSSRKRSTTSETAAGIEPTRKRLASGSQYITLIQSKFILSLKLYYYFVYVRLEHVPGESQDVFGFHCRAFVCERRGERPEMQDAHIAIEDATPALKQLRRLHNEMHALFFNAYSKECLFTFPCKICYFSSRSASYFAVFDGHNGARVSKLASQQLHDIIFAQFPPGTHYFAQSDLI